MTNKIFRPECKFVADVVEIVKENPSKKHKENCQGNGHQQVNNWAYYQGGLEF